MLSRTADRPTPEQLAPSRRVVPLGHRCRLTHNLRRHTGRDDAWPFDWLILPGPGLLHALERDLDPAALFAPDSLAERRSDDGAIETIVNPRFNIVHEHDFPRGPDGHVLPDWRDHLGTAAGRYARLGRRLRALGDSGTAVLFVRETMRSDPPDTIEALLPLLRRVVPQAELLVVNPARTRVPPGIAAVTVTERPGLGWRGDEPAWSAALAAAGLPAA